MLMLSTSVTLREPSMNVHKNARMTVFGRERLVKQVLERVLTPAAAAAAAGVSQRTVYKLLARFKKEGLAGLRDRGSRPKRVRCALSARQRCVIEQLRRDRRPYREIAKRAKAPLSTVARYVKRLGLNRLEVLDPKPPVQRYEHERPGDLVHLDIKRLSRFWRPGHRMTGSRLGQSEGAGYQDNGSGYRSKHFARACRRLGIKHSFTRPHRPQTNGKAERFIKTALNEWAYVRIYTDYQERAKAWLPWLHRYNWHRPHASLNDQPPIRRLGLSVNNLSALHN